MKLFVTALLSLLSFIATAQVIDFTDIEQVIHTQAYDSTFINFNPTVNQQQKLGIVGHYLYMGEKHCKVDSFNVDEELFTTEFYLNCDGNFVARNLESQDWYLEGALAKYNSNFKGVEFIFDNPKFDLVDGMNGQIFNSNETFVLKELKYGKVGEDEFSLVAFFENGYIEKVQFNNYVPDFSAIESGKKLYMFARDEPMIIAQKI